MRSGLWNPESFVERTALPSPGELLRSALGESFDAAKYDTDRAARYARRAGFY